MYRAVTVDVPHVIRRKERAVNRSVRITVSVVAVALAPQLKAPLALATAGWVDRCPYSHSRMDDPIVFPKQPGASHLHDFFGAMHTNAYSTVRTMRNGSRSGERRDDAASSV